MMVHDSTKSVVFPFGKYKGYSLYHVAQNDPSYLKWITSKDGFNKTWKEASRRAIEGEDVSDLKVARTKNSKVGTNRPKSDKKTKVEIIEIDKNKAKILMPYDELLINRFKSTIDGRKWNAKEKFWEFPIVHLPRVVDLIDSYEVKVTPEIKKIYKKLLEEEREKREIRKKLDTDFEVEGLKLELFPFQKAGVEFAEVTKGRCLIADQPGLGKTCQGLAYAQMNNLKTLIVCPLSVVTNWRKEIEKWTGKGSVIWSTKGHDGHLNHQFHIVNYDAIRKLHKKLRKIDYDLLICDEATYLKNRNTLRFKSLLGSYKERRKYPGIKTKHVLFLTGTPVMNRPIEAFTLLNFLDKERFKNFYHFTQRYGGWKGSPVKNLDELHERTKDLVIRRKKAEVDDEFPEKQRNDLYISLSDDERKRYNELLDELFGEWSFNGKPTIGTMPAIQQFLIECKMPRLRGIIDEYLDNDRPILIFCCYINPLKQLFEEYKDVAGLIYGDISKEERQEIIDDLSEGNKKLGLFSLKAAGMGIDSLQKQISTVVFLDYDWVPANHEQAEDRVHRIGQTNKVQSFYMVAEDTIDEYMRELVQEKNRMAAEVVDGEIINPVNTKSIFSDFVQKLRWENED